MKSPLTHSQLDHPLPDRDRNVAACLNRSRAMLLLAVGLLASIAAAVSAPAANYYIREIISVHPGEEQARSLSVGGIFSLPALAPVEAFIVYSWGYEVPAGDLTVELECVAESFYSRRIGFSLVIGGYSRKQKPVLAFKRALFPEAISRTVAVQSTFGIYYVGVLVNGTRGDVHMPVPFVITFAVSAGEGQQ